MSTQRHAVTLRTGRDIWPQVPRPGRAAEVRSNSRIARPAIPGMTGGMTRYEKLAISLPSRCAENARRAVRQGKAASVSAYIASAIETHEKRDGLDLLIEDILARTGGPLTAAETRWADEQLG